MDNLTSSISWMIIVLFVGSVIRASKKASRNHKTKASKGGRPAPLSKADRSSSAQTSMNPSAPPKPWQIGKHNVKPVLNGKTSRGKAFGQRPKRSSYNSAFEDKGLLSGTVSAFGDARDIISSGSMAASNAEYMDVGNDYVSSFDVGGRKETPNGFDR